MALEVIPFTYTKEYLMKSLSSWQAENMKNKNQALEKFVFNMF